MHAVILAAGRSSRFWPLNTRHKSLVSIAGRTLLEHTLHGLHDHDVTDVVIVERPDSAIQDTITVPDGMDATFVTQEHPDGMGNALEQAREHVADDFVVSSPYRFDIGSLLEHMSSADASYDGAVSGAETAHPERYGVLNLSEDRETATGVVEKPSPENAPSNYKVVSTYLLSPDFFTYLDAVETHEYHFEDALDRYMQDNTVQFVELEQEPPSLKYPWDLFPIVEAVLDRQEPRIADSAEIHDNVTIDGDVVIEADVTVYENATIRGPCYIGKGATIGSALVRAYTSIGADCLVGTNAEVRGSVFQPGATCHSGFIGDSILGRNTQIGAGTVTANRGVRNSDGERPTISVHVHEKDETVDTGRDRLGAMIGPDVDVGTQVNLMPGICIGQGTFIGPSAFVNRNVGEHKTFFTKHNAVEQDRKQE